MRLVIYCEKCHERNGIKVVASDRHELRLRYGDHVELTCNKCKAKGKYSLREVKAEIRYLGLIAAILFIMLFLLTVFLLWEYNWHASGSVYLLPAGLIIAALVYATAVKGMRAKVKSFNRS